MVDHCILSHCICVTLLTGERILCDEYIIIHVSEIKDAPAKFELAPAKFGLGVAPYPARVRGQSGHLNHQLITLKHLIACVRDFLK